MSRSKSSASYPPLMLDALNTAIEKGELIIPTDNPLALRLEFNGLRGALRCENRSEQADLVGLYIRKASPGVSPALILRNKGKSPLMAAVASALNHSPPAPSEDAENALKRILGL